MRCRAGTFRVCFLGKLLSRNQTGRYRVVGYIVAGEGEEGTHISPRSSAMLLPEEGDMHSPLQQVCKHHSQWETVGICLSKTQIPCPAELSSTGGGIVALS